MDILELTTGKLRIDQLDLIMRSLPIELTFADENDIYQYYTDFPGMIFPREPDIIGTDLYDCHPESSHKLIKELLEEFRSGKKDSFSEIREEKGKTISIKYFAIRNTNGIYKGVLEVIQSVGEFRLDK